MDRKITPLIRQVKAHLTKMYGESIKKVLRHSRM